MLPYRSVYVGNRCFFTISNEVKLSDVEREAYVRRTFSDDFMHEVNVEIRPANVDRYEVVQELLKGQLIKVQRGGAYLSHICSP